MILARKLGYILLAGAGGLLGRPAAASKLFVFIGASIVSASAEDAVAAPAVGVDGAEGSVSGASAAQAAAAPLLLSLLKELRSEAEAGVQFASAMTQWCGDAASQKKSMGEVLRRQLDEAGIAVRQVALDEKRLASEARLVNASTHEKEAQLQEAVQTATLATQEFDDEQREMQKIAEAARHAIRLIQLQTPEGGQHAGIGASLNGLSSLLTQNDASGVADGVRSLGDAYLRSGKENAEGSDPSGAAAKSRELVEMLVRLRNRLDQDMNSAGLEHQGMVTKLYTFTDHLNSSIMETRSQIAVIRTQATQRKREHARLNGRVGDLSTLLQALRQSESVTITACKEEEKQRGEVARHIAAESGIVTALLKQMPVGSLSLLFGGAGASTEALPPSFLQVSAASEETQHTAAGRALAKLKTLAHEYPAEAELYADAVKAMEDGEGSTPTPVTMPRALAHSHSERKTRASEGASDAGSQTILDDEDDEGTNALRNIRQFVKAEASGMDADDMEGSVPSAGLVATTEASGLTSPSKPEISGRNGNIYTGLIGRVRAKERVVAALKSQCASIARDAQVDMAALSRSAKRVDAKLRMAKATTSEYEQSSAYELSQKKLIETHLQKLDSLSKESDHQNTRLRTELRRHAEQLMALATDLGQQLTADEQRSAHIVRDLVQKVEDHYHGLYQRHQHFVRRRNAVAAVDGRLLRLLAEDAAHNKRRMTRLKSETQLLSSLAYAKGNDHALSKRYNEVVGQLCSKDRLHGYDVQAQQLKAQEGEIQHIASDGDSSTSPPPAASTAPSSPASPKAVAEEDVQIAVPAEDAAEDVATKSEGEDNEQLLRSDGVQS